MKREICLSTVFALTLNACASYPGGIEPKYVSPIAFQHWSCEQLADEKKRLASEVTRVADLQRENANADTVMMTVGIIILWPVLFGLAATKDRQDELARLKGEFDAVEQSERIRPCLIPPPAAPPVARAPL